LDNDLNQENSMASITLYSTSNLLRYVSEWDPREPAHTKGGYMDGEIKIPNVSGTLRMVIQTYPAEDVDSLVAKIHPCLLHVVQIVKGRREQDLEPVPTYYHWRQIFEIIDGKVFVLNETSELDFKNDGTQRPVPERVEVTKVIGNTIVLGRKKEELNLILLQPKQQARAKPTEATITKVLADRLPTHNKEEIERHEQFFIKKFSRNLKRIRLRVDFYDEKDVHCGGSVSPQTIIDTGNKEIGSMDLYDATPLKSCVLGGRKIIMVSEYNLAKGVWPIFQVHDEYDQHCPQLDQYLAQPQQCIVKNQTIIFLSPPQPYLQLLEKQINNFSIKLLAKREGDGYTSKKEFEFKYIDHKFNNCPFCDLKIDTDEPVQIEEGIERPKPGTKKRKMDQKTSPNMIKQAKPELYTPSPSPPYRNDSYEVDGGYTSNSELEYTTTLTQNQLDNLETLTENAKLVILEEDMPLSQAQEATAQQNQTEMKVMEQNTAEFATETQVRTALGMNVEEHWGHDGFNDIYEDDIENIPIEELLHISPAQDMIYDDISEYIQTIQPDSVSNGERHIVQRDSTRGEGQQKQAILAEAVEPKIEEAVSPKRSPKVNKPTHEQETSCLEDLPLLSMIFMILLVISTWIGQSFIKISNSGVIIFSMTCAISLVFLKNKT